MIRKSTFFGALTMLVMPAAVMSASTESLPIKIATFSVAAPTAGKNTLNALKATASFKINKETSTRALKAYGSGTNANNVRQCVELIKRYAAALGFAKFVGQVGSGDIFTGTASLGNGNLTASNFATASNGGFVFVSNGATSLPKPGAVISIETWTTSGGTYIPGHVGIVINYSTPSASATTVSLKIFEQNMPLDYWKEVVFTKSNGKWTGAMPNSGKYPKVVGWANPAG